MPIVNVSVANIYRSDSYRSEMISQALLWERVEVITGGKDFSQIRMEDGYEGWISNYQITDAKENPANIQTVIRPVVTILDTPNGKPVRDAVMGCKIPALQSFDGQLTVLLPDGKKGYSDAGNFGSFPEPTRENSVLLAKQFLGIPYVWGGRSAKGFDCSGFTQSIYKWMGKQIARDAWMQHRDLRFVSSNPEDAAAGDLYFFAENGSKITHVGLAMGNGKIIHARGMVRINSLIPEQNGFDEQLRNSFVSVQTIW